MDRPYKAPRHLQHLAKTVNAARTQVGWGVHDDGSVGLEHIMSSNPFAGKAKVWGIANITDDGDIQIQSNGPGNSGLEGGLPEDLVQQIVQFYEKEGLNVRNVHEFNPDVDKKTAEVDQGYMACPHCGSVEGLYPIPMLDGKYVCRNCNSVNDERELVREGEDPDPDRNMREDDPDYSGMASDYDDNWQDDIVSKKEAATGWSTQGAPAGGNTPATGIVVRPDRQSRDEIEAMVGGLNPSTPHEIQRDYVDKMNEGMGTSFPAYDNPYVNRGAKSIDTYFIESDDWEKLADGPQPVGVPGTGYGDPRNFNPQTQPGYIVVSQWLTPDDNWLFTTKCKGIVAERGGTTSHGAVVARAMGIPAVVAAEDAVKIQPGDTVTLDPNTGRIDVNGGDSSYQMQETRKAARELVRFVWSKGNQQYAQVTGNEETDKLHADMLEDMMMEDKYDFEDGTIGVIYDDGDAQYYEPISDPGDLENWLKSTFPNLVQKVTYKPVQGGIYTPGAGVTAAAEQEEGKAPVCPECGSHSYDVVAFPNETVGPAQLRCLNDNTIYEWTLYMNPKNSSEKLALAYPDDPNEQDQVVALMRQIIEAHQIGDEKEVDRLKAQLAEMLGPYRAAMYLGAFIEADFEDEHLSPSLGQPTQCPKCGSDDTQWVKGQMAHCENCGCDFNGYDGHSIYSSMQKGAPYPSDSYKNAPDHTPKGQKEWPEEVNAIYNACMREGNGSGDTKEEKQSSCAAIAWAQYKKNKGKPKDSDKDKESKVAAEEGKYSPGTRVELQHKNVRGRGTVLEYAGKHDDLDEEKYHVQMDNGDKLEDIPESAFKRIKSAGVTGLDHHFLDTLDAGFETEEIEVEAATELPLTDTNGAPIESGRMYLMHCPDYKIPDVVRIINVSPNQIEAHIDSDTRGMFPITIDRSEYESKRYSFEPKEAAYEELYQHVKLALDDLAKGQTPAESSPEVMAAVEKAMDHFGDPGRALAALNDEGAFSNFMLYYADKNHVGKVAARKLTMTPKRQKELINENMGGKARNYNKLNLEGTHYNMWELVEESSWDDPLQTHFLW